MKRITKDKELEENKRKEIEFEEKTSKFLQEKRKEMEARIFESIDQMFNNTLVEIKTYKKFYNIKEYVNIFKSIIKYIASTSGCSIIITIDTFTYIFGLFEGFQRYYIEKGLTIKSIYTIFITKKEEISSLCGLFLTLRDMGKSHLNIVCNKDLQFIISKTYFFCQPNSLKLNFISNLYIDRNIIVSNNFKIEIKDIKGRLLDYMENDIKLNTIYIINDNIFENINTNRTGCAIPSKYRNVSGILLSLQNKFILLDCGEDTINQIYRISGSYKIIDKLDLIFISHSHADHCLGIINVLIKVKNQIKVMGPSIVLNFLKILFNNLTLIYTDELKLIEKNYDINKKNEKDCIKIFKFDYYVEICGCLHNVDSCSISIKDENYKISYSGDSRPSPLFCYISKNADVMIHECTFDDENKANAYKTLHSTLKEAENIFTLSQSKKLLLTHFSQRFPKKFDQKTIGIPCYDFYLHVIGKSEYDSCNFVNYF
ncbi:ribonuclease z [Vairimorpha apis BRL 01]|uniref:ribonuclease Z n=1 Tax=Vairimorpha apis BRL 01 TaxID=1037528 RepID=T0LBT3_9MICR|nr:ribonuclease z [Vairimorpha apis BRL 01]